jgi:hypothetical protein
MKPTISSIEFLEARIAPASVIMFTDVDGDTVTVKSSKGILTNALLHFEDRGLGKQLTEIDVNTPMFQGTNLTFKVKKGPTGDGLVNVGYIDATGVDLGTVNVPGDIGRIDAGDGNTNKPAIKTLIAKSLGAYHDSTQSGGVGGEEADLDAVRSILTELVSTTTGTATGLLGVIQDQVQDLLGSGSVIDSTLSRLLTGLASDIQSLLDLGSEAIGDVTPAIQSLLGNIVNDITGLLDIAGLDPTALPSALVTQLGNVIGKVNDAVFQLLDPLGLGGTVSDVLAKLQGTVQEVLGLLSGPFDPTLPENLLSSLENALSGSGGILGGLLDALLGTGGQLTSLINTLGDTLDDLIGGTQTGVTTSALLDDIVALEAHVSAALATNPTGGTLTLLTDVKNAIGDILVLPQALLNDLLGGLGGLDGVLGNLLGGLPGNGPEGLQSLIENIAVLLNGITGNLSDVLENGGEILSSTLRDLALLESQLVSVLGSVGGQLTEDARTSITSVVKMIVDLLGTNPDDGDPTNPSTRFNILGDIGTIRIARDISNIFLNVIGGIKKLTVGGSLIGGADVNSGEIFTTGNIGNVKIGKHLLGGLNLNSGLIQSGGQIKTTSIAGSIIGGLGNSSGEVIMNSDASRVHVKGDLIGNSGLFSASIDNTNGRIGSVKIGGSVVSGLNTESGSIRVMGDIGNLTVRGSLIGDDDNGVIISAAATKAPNEKNNFAFRNISVGGRVAFATILGGYDTDLEAVNSHAQVGRVLIKGDWFASNLAAGAVPGDSEPENFGTNFDAVITGGMPGSVLSKIASIVIKGTVIGTTEEGGDNFGFVAQQIGSFKFGTNKLKLNKGAGNDAIKISQGTGADVAIHELGATLT